MKITDYRKGTNQYRSKSKYRKVVLGLFIVIVGIGLYQYYSAPKTPKTAPGTTFTHEDGLTDEQRLNLEKQADLAKQEQVLLNKKETLENQIRDIENQLGEVRSQKVTFTSAKTQ